MWACLRMSIESITTILTFSNILTYMLASAIIIILYIYTLRQSAKKSLGLNRTTTWQDAGKADIISLPCCYLQLGYVIIVICSSRLVVVLHCGQSGMYDHVLNTISISSLFCYCSRYVVSSCTGCVSPSVLIKFSVQTRKTTFKMLRQRSVTRQSGTETSSVYPLWSTQTTGKKKEDNSIKSCAVEDRELW